MQWWQQPEARAALTLGVAWLVILVVSRIALSVVTRNVADTAARYRLRKFIGFLSLFVAAFAATVVYSDRLGGLTVAFGVAGAGIAFALQEVIASFAGWVAIMAGGYYRSGDRVQLRGIVGDVIDIGMLRTTLMETGGWVKGDLYNGRLVTIANSFVFKEPVFNYSSNFPFLWDELLLPVRYGSDRAWVRATLKRVAEEEVGEFARNAKGGWKTLSRSYLIEEAQVEPMITMVANDNWMEFTIRYVVDYKLRRTTRDRLYTKILDAFEASKGRALVASTTIELVSPATESEPAEKD
ncbi:MAG: mechanosensitive ion channel family protein [Fimbriimonadaceae bacterium]|nr:mechanosensitive ion channel family protein [Fimbriimonadaceae bacterium]